MKVATGSWMIGAALMALAAASLNAQTPPLASRIGHTDAARYRTLPKVHDGAGSMQFAELLGAGALSTNLMFVHRGVIPPKSGIGEHFHHQGEEMFVILEGGAEFTIDGRTALIPGPAAVPDKMGHAHGLYNPGDKPLQWLNVNVGTTKAYDAFNLGDPRVGVARDPIPQFVSVRLDRALLKPAAAAEIGRGSILSRRMLDPAIFSTPWSFVDHMLLMPGSETARIMRPAMSEAYYVVAGTGQIDVAGEIAPIKTGDAVPVDLGQAHVIRQTGDAPLELMVIGIARDLAAKAAFATEIAAARRPR